MYKLKKLNDVDKHARWIHFAMLCLEWAVSLASVGLVIYYMVNGDPNGRIPATLGSIAVFLVPFLLELIFKIRFAPIAHIVFTIHVTLSIFCGCALNMHNSVGPFDEIMHFIFGYVGGLFIFYLLISWKDYDRQKTLPMTAVIFIMSLGLATLWELLEFSLDVTIGQSGLGKATEEVINQGIALGYSGIALHVYAIKNSVLVWDTITDMALHFGGTLLFCIQYIIHRHIKKPLMLAYVRKDYDRNKAYFYDYIPSDEITTEETIDKE